MEKNIINVERKCVYCSAGTKMYEEIDYKELEGILSKIKNNYPIEINIR